MSHPLDLTQALQAAAEAHYTALIETQRKRAEESGAVFHGMSWEQLPAINRHAFAEALIPALDAAAPHLASQGFQHAAEIGIVLDPDPWAA